MMYNLNGSLHARFAVLFSNGNIIILLFTNRSLGNPKGNAKFARARVFTCIIQFAWVTWV